MTEPGPPLTIVISSGRCGSTALSAATSLNPRVLSLSEFFRCIGPMAFASGRHSAVNFWQVLAKPRAHMTAMLRYRVEPQEVLYPVDGHLRFTRQSGVPPVSLIALPHLSDTPDFLLDELHDYVLQLPEQTMPDHFRSLFRWLCQRLGREIVVERSGGSLAAAQHLIRCFPEARFIHLYRDGRRVAVSMSRHSAFRLWLAVERITRSADPEGALDELGAKVLLGRQPTTGELAAMALGGRLGRLMSDMGVPAERRHEPVWRFGALWSAMVHRGLAAFAAMSPGPVIALDFDDMLADPEAGLYRISRFVEGGRPEGEGQWVTQATKTLRASSRDWAGQLSSLERQRLEIACRPGMRLLYGRSDPQPARENDQPPGHGARVGAQWGATA